jgi:methionine-rich copper-binding protein CopC
MRRSIRYFVVYSILLCLVGVKSAQAHAELVRASPGPDERLAESPHQIVLFFDEELDTRVSHFSVYDGQRQPVAAIEGRVDLADPEHARMVAADLPTLPEDVYTVRWMALSTDGDGDVTQGEFDFIIGNAQPRARPASSPTAPALATPPGGSASGPETEVNGLPFGVLLVAGLALVAAAMGVGLLRSRQPK